MTDTFHLFLCYFLSSYLIICLFLKRLKFTIGILIYFGNFSAVLLLLFCAYYNRQKLMIINYSILEFYKKQQFTKFLGYLFVSIYIRYSNNIPIIKTHLVNNNNMRNVLIIVLLKLYIYSY